MYSRLQITLSGHRGLYALFLALALMAGALSGCDEKAPAGNGDGLATPVDAAMQIALLDVPDTSQRNAHYVSNRPPLQANPLIKLPVGSIQPRGWLRRYLELQRDGLTGHLGEISAWLQKEDNAWLSPEGQGKWGWEEVPYWLKGYANIGYILGDQEMIDETRIWIEGTLASQRDDGDFGPQRVKRNQGRDYWANMVMLFALQSWYEVNGDERVIELMSGFFDYLENVPDKKFLSRYWQHQRGGDLLHSVLWLYNRTGEPRLLELAHKVHRNTSNWALPDHLPDWHNVNIAQGFREPATYFQLTGDPAHLEATYDNHHFVRQLFGQVPGGMWGGDENSRLTYDDPHQAIETCGIVEQLFSNELLLRITGDVFWADHAEEVAFNTAPAAYMPDFRGLRYLTAPNMVLSDAENHAPGIQNEGPFLAMSALSSRCCQHNHAQGWPYYSKHLWMATPDNGLAAVLYAASDVTATVGEGHEVRLSLDSHYPFEQQVRITVHGDDAVHFPLYLRVPSWADGAGLNINGQAVETGKSAGGYIRIERRWQPGDTVTLDLPMQLNVKRWAKNHNAVSIELGPLTFSLNIEEEYRRRDPRDIAIHDSEWQEGLDFDEWPAFEIFPASAWNYGLLLEDENPTASFDVRWGPWPDDDFPFTREAAPVRILATARRIPEWGLDKHGLVRRLFDSPVKSAEPDETVELIPMGAARLRISAFPVIGEGDDARTW